MKKEEKTIKDCNDKKEIHLITIGEYSDYSVVAAFSNIEKAKEYIETFGDEYRIESITLDEEIKRKGKVWTVCFYTDSGNKLKEATAGEFTEKDLVYIYDGYYNVQICFTVFAKTKTKAVKIASERLSFIKSNPYLFPLLRVKCIENKLFSSLEYPTYNFKTTKIDIDDIKKISENYAKMVDVALGKDKTATEEQIEEALVALKLKQPKPKPKPEPTKAKVVKVDRFGQIIEQKLKEI